MAKRRQWFRKWRGSPRLRASKYGLRFGPPVLVLGVLALVLAAGSRPTSNSESRVSVDVDAISSTDGLASDLECAPGENVLVANDLVDVSRGAFATAEAAIEHYVNENYTGVSAESFASAGEGDALSVFVLREPSTAAFVVAVESANGWVATDSVACAGWATTHERSAQPTAPLTAGDE